MGTASLPTGRQALRRKLSKISFDFLLLYCYSPTRMIQQHQEHIVEKPSYDEALFGAEVEAEKQKTLREIESMKQRGGSFVTMAQGLEKMTGARDEIKWRLAFLNNFHGHLPGGYKRKYTAKDIQQAKPTEEILLNKKVEDDLDAIIKRLGLNQDEITSWESANIIQEHPQILISLYIEMRKLGYKHYPDLVQ